MCWCRIRERNPSTFSRCYSSRSRPKFEFSTFLWLPLSLPVCWMSLDLCLSESCFLNPCLCGSVCVPNKWLFFVFIGEHRKHRMGKEWNTSQKSVADIYEELSHWRQLAQTDRDNNQYYKYHCLSDIQHSWWKFIFSKLAFNICFVFSTNDCANTATNTHAYLFASGACKTVHLRIITVH